MVWNQGIPDRDPPAAKGLQLIFADDFDGPLSISNDGRGATYMAYKPGGGDFSGWRFSNVLGDGKPFGQKETWLRIAARKDEESPKGRTGILASVNREFEGVWAKAPCYLECRFTAQSAIGTWPAFWTLALGDEGTDELDIVEAYPYEKYDVYVYLGADADQGSGSVTISSPSGEVDANGTYFYWKRRLDGLFVVSEATSLEKAEPSNYVVFKENTAKEFDIEWAGNLKNGWTGVSGVQIVVRH